MTTTELRTLALALKNRIADSYAALLPAYTEITGWTLNGADDALPTIAELKAVYNAFNAFEKPDYRLVEEVRALKLTTEEAVALVDQIAPFPHTHLVTDITNFPVTMPPAAHATAWTDITGAPATYPPAAHATAWADITGAPATYPPAAHAHDLLQIGDMLLRYHTGGYLEQSTNAGATWTPLVSESAPPSATAYALAWTDGSAIFSRQVPGAWLNGDLQIWMRVYLSSNVFFWFGDVTMTHNSGGIYLSSFDSNGDGSDYPDDRTTITEGWHDVALQWTQAANSCILYIDGVGGTPFTAYKRTLDAATNYNIRFQAAGLKVASLVMSDQLTWDTTTAAKDTIGAPLFSLPLAEGSGATTTDSTNTAWTIPTGVVWETLS